MKSEENWFKNKNYGIGWKPGNLKSWILLAIYLLVVIGLALVFLKDVPANTYTKEVGYFLIAVLIVTIVFIWFSSKKSPKPRWSWGKKTSGNPNKDL